MPLKTALSFVGTYDNVARIDRARTDEVYPQPRTCTEAGTLGPLGIAGTAFILSRDLGRAVARATNGDNGLPVVATDLGLSSGMGKLYYSSS